MSDTAEPHPVDPETAGPAIDSSDPPGARRRPTPARERFIVVLALLALGGAATLAATQTWSTASLRGYAAVTASGQTASPALASLGIVLFALAGALAIAGPIARYALAVLLVLLGAAMVAISLPGIVDPAADAKSAITTVTGIEGDASIRAIVTGISATGWPVVAALAGLLTAAAGIAVAIRGRRWPSGGRRYRAADDRVPTDTAAGRPTDAVDEWDALTAGADPTERDAPTSTTAPVPPIDTDRASDPDR